MLLSNIVQIFSGAKKFAVAEVAEELRVQLRSLIVLFLSANIESVGVK
jgi:hypothetical protein